MSLLYVHQDEQSPLLQRISHALEEMADPTADEGFTLAGLPRKGEVILARFSADDQVREIE